MATISVDEMHVRITADASDLKRGLGEAQANLQGVSDRLGAVSERIGKVGREWSLKVTAPILGLGAASFKASKDFEKSMSEIVGLVGVSRSQVEEWKKELLEMGPALGKTPQELADGLFFVTSAGFRGAEALDILRISAQASAAGLGETKVIADVVTSAVNAYGIENLNAAQAADVLVAAVREGKAAAPELAGSLGSVLPVASALGISFDQVGAAMAAMTRTGTGASEAATQLSGIMSGLLKPTKQAEETLNGIGLSSADLRRQLREEGLIAVLQTLKGSFGDNEEAMGRVFSNVRALRGVLDLLGENAEDNIAIFDSLTDSTGALEQAFDEAADTAEHAWRQSLAQVNASSIVLGDAVKEVLVPNLQSLTNALGRATQWFQGLSETQQRNVVYTGLLVASIGPLLVLMAGLLRIVSNLIVAARALGVALMWLRTNPIGLILTALALLVMAGVYVYRNWDEIKYRGLQIWGSMKIFVVQQVREIIAAFERLVAWIPKVGDAVKRAREGLDDMVADERQLMAMRSLEQQTRRSAAAAQELQEEALGAGDAFVDMGDAAEFAMPPLESLAGGLDGIGDAAKAGGTKAKEAAEDTRQEWERAADVLSNRLQILKNQYDIAALAAEKKGDKAEELRLKLDYLNRQLDVQRDMVAAVKRGYDEVVAAKGADAEESQKLELRLVQEQRAQAELEKQVRETTRALRDHAGELRNLANEAERVADKYRNDLAEAHEEYQRRVADVNRRLTDDERRVTEQYESELQRRTRALIDWTGLFDQVARRDVSGEGLLENLRGQVTAFEDWEANIAELVARGVDQGLIEELREMGPKAGPEIAALLRLTDQQLVEYVSLWRQKNEQARREAVDQLQRQRQEMQQQLVEIRNAAREQLEIYLAEWEKKNAEIRKNAEEEMRRIEERFQSIAEAGTTYGVRLMDNFTAGIQSRADQLRDTLFEIAAIVDSYMPHSPAKVGPLRRLNEWGPALVRGLADGMEKELSSARRRLAQMAETVRQAFSAQIPQLRQMGSGLAALSPAALGPAIVRSQVVTHERVALLEDSAVKRLVEALQAAGAGRPSIVVNVHDNVFQDGRDAGNKIYDSLRRLGG